MRIILYTARAAWEDVRGGDGLHLADAGRRVLVASTDAAHSLGDALDVAVGSAPVSPRTWTRSNDPAVVAMGGLQAHLRTLMTSHADAGIETDELLVFPGLEELFAAGPARHRARHATCSSWTVRRRDAVAAQVPRAPRLVHRGRAAQARTPPVDARTEGVVKMPMPKDELSTSSPRS